ncbi:Alpha/Beta hydrolase protein [Xylariomycetidae sp. FL0641]|nr:Alpha/Beta hydrolase protein [Xylariomycetidae sp. FL0641]
MEAIKYGAILRRRVSGLVRSQKTVFTRYLEELYRRRFVPLVTFLRFPLVDLAQSIIPSMANRKDNLVAELLDVQPSDGAAKEGYRAMDLTFFCPLDYEQPLAENNRIEVGFTLVHGNTKNSEPKKITLDKANVKKQLVQEKILVYLCGGPGVDNPPFKMKKFNDFFLRKGYRILYPDYRGTGKSSSDRMKPENPELFRLAKYLRQTDIARDLESVRRFLGVEKWTTWGQSYGTWITLTYLSFHPEGLRETFLTGGLPPITPNNAKETYDVLFADATKANRNYYAKYDNDRERVVRIAMFLAEKEKIELHDKEKKNLGTLTLHRFLSLGRILGNASHHDKCHQLLQKMEMDIKREGRLKQDTLESFMKLDGWKLNQRPLFALLHEGMYMNKKGEASKWGAKEAAKKHPNFWWVNTDGKPEQVKRLEQLEKKIDSKKERNEPLGEDETLYFSTEMVYPSAFDTWSELLGLKGVGQQIAEYEWHDDLYDFEQLGKNKVPMTAMSYANDVYVSIDLTKKAKEVLNQDPKYLSFQVHPYFEHGAVRNNADEVLKTLWDARPAAAKST